MRIEKWPQALLAAIKRRVEYSHLIRLPRSCLQRTMGEVSRWGGHVVYVPLSTNASFRCQGRANATKRYVCIYLLEKWWGRHTLDARRYSREISLRYVLIREDTYDRKAEVCIDAC
jgi:hypothetical protein